MTASQLASQCAQREAVVAMLDEELHGDVTGSAAEILDLLGGEGGARHVLNRLQC
jgi:hypothetical protein